MSAEGVHMKNDSLNKVLKECKRSADKGYKIAREREKYLSQTLAEAEDKVTAALNEFNSTKCYSDSLKEMLERQLTDINSEFSNLSAAFKDNLTELWQNLSEFSVTLFGRTMAGKSTLMEILTEGNGDSIGKGGQRTTRDIRTYKWNGLKITDVPGIGAFDGAQDEMIAFEAAKTADLILFLLTDNAPQPNEADWFNKVTALGKPVICIMNVKISISPTSNPRLVKYDFQQGFDKTRLENTKNQFLEFAGLYGQDWNSIPFVYVHLKSAFMAQHEQDPKKAEEFYRLSRIELLKDKIVEQIKSKGEFYRIKTFIDIISVPLLQSLENLLSHSQLNSEQGQTVLEKKEQFEDWRHSFRRDSKKRIDSCISSIKSDLSSEIAVFAEEHYDDKNADKAWTKLLEEWRIEERCISLLEGLEDKVNDKIREISREIEKEIEFRVHFSDGRSLRMDKIIDGKKICDWANIILSGGLGIAAGIAALAGAAAAGPLGGLAIAVAVVGTLGSFLFKSKDKKIKDARKRLESGLNNHISKQCEELKKTMNDSLELLIKERVDCLIDEMEKITTVVRALSDTQRNLAWGLNGQLLALNDSILSEAIRLIAADGLQYHILTAARIPGNSCVILLKKGEAFPKELTAKLSGLMSEKISFAYDDGKKNIISEILGPSVAKRRISIDKDIATVSVSNPTPEIINRVRLAQQLAQIHIVNSEVE